MRYRNTIAITIFISLFASMLTPGVVAQTTDGSPVVITIGRPNIWSLEQAHYLLARMHHTNRDIQADRLTNLNPNEINANQIRLLRQIFGLSADFAQVKAPKPADDEEAEKETAENKASLDVSLPESAIKELPENAFSDPKLNASTVLENYINLQYEIISRQLTLLRDEVGPGERLVFLELPHSVFTTDKKANKRLVQVWWQLEGYSTSPCDETCQQRAAAENEVSQRTLADVVADAAAARANSPGRNQLVSFRNVQSGTTIRTIDLIPRQSSLILNKTYDSVSGLNLSGAFAWLFGLGVKGSYQRQKETFEQYLHQEVYASAFGKGETDFGWTFAPTPGTKRLNPGLRTTYAVVIVPKEAESISLNAKGCFFKQSSNQPLNYSATGTAPWNQFSNDRFCDPGRNFIIPVPNDGDYNGLRVTAIRYHPGQAPGSRIVVSVKGKNFSPQIGVMINGVPLRPSVGIAQPFLDKVNSQDATYKEVDGISGEVEFVDSEELIFSFRMPESFAGTPTIHLVGPGRAVYLNRLPRVRVNNPPVVVTLDDSDWMFGNRPPNGFQITDFKVFPTGTPNRFVGLLIGSNFARTSRVFINGRQVPPVIITRVSGREIRFPFTADSSEEIVATIVNGPTPTSPADSTTYRRPYPLIASQWTPVSYKNEVMIVKVDGSGFGGLRIVRLEGGDINDSTVSVNGPQAILRIVKPKDVVEITLENAAGNTARSIIIRPEK